MQDPKDEFLQSCHVGLELSDGDEPRTTKTKANVSSHGLIGISKHYFVVLHCTINILAWMIGFYLCFDFRIRH